MTFVEGVAILETGSSASIAVASNAEIYLVNSTAEMTDDGYLAATVEAIIQADKSKPVAVMSGKDFAKWLGDL